MTPANLATVRFKSRQPVQDEEDLARVLKEKKPEFSVLFEMVESAGGTPNLSRLYVAMLPSVAYVEAKFLDLLSSRLQNWLDSRTSVDEIELYGSDGEVVKLMKRTKH